MHDPLNSSHSPRIATRPIHDTSIQLWVAGSIRATAKANRSIRTTAFGLTNTQLNRINQRFALSKCFDSLVVGEATKWPGGNHQRPIERR